MRPLHYDLELHLAFLLFQQDSLHVPGLGVFSVRRYGAEIQLPAGLILPPARRLSFAPEAQETRVFYWTTFAASRALAALRPPRQQTFASQNGTGFWTEAIALTS